MQLASQDLVEPFEWVYADGPKKGSIARPVVYAFQHVVLPDALFTWHPELARVLRGRPTLPPLLGHMWAMTSVYCAERGLTRPGSTKGMEGYWEYVLPMAKEVQVTSADTGRYSVWILTMPPLKAVPDCYFVALCKPKAETDEYLLGRRSQESRYFTLEASGEQGTGYFCAWESGGQHVNLGYQDSIAPDHFVSLVSARLGN